MNVERAARSSSVEALNFVCGAEVEGDTRVPVVDPASPVEQVGTVHFASKRVVDEAANAAAAAAQCWRRLPLAERISCLREGLAGVEALGPAEALAVLLTREQGKVLSESRFETGRVAALFDLFSGLVEEALAEDRLDDERGRRIRGYAPIGPVAAITPWNWPVSLSMGKVVPALLAGNPVVLKPPPTAPLTISRIAGALAARLPRGVLNVVNGGGEVGAALVAHPAIRKVVFTGSIANGRRVFAACADGIKKMILELGGNDAAVLLDDVELDETTTARLVGSAFITSGQVCWAIKRVYAPATRYSEVVDALVAAANRLVVGNGLQAAVTTGPLHNAAQLSTVRDMVSQARDAGATVIECGSIASGTDWEPGYFHRPAIVSGIDDNATLVREEQFGPALPVLAYDDVEEAVRRANNTIYGLCASVWTADPERGFAVARTLEAGQVFVNCHAGPALDYQNAFGGIKQSGFGREMGVVGMREYLEARLYSSRILR